MKHIRRENVVATIGDHEGRPCTLETKKYDSINLAKKANGLNSRTLKRGEKFPPTVNDYMMADIPEAA